MSKTSIALLLLALTIAVHASPLVQALQNQKMAARSTLASIQNGPVSSHAYSDSPFDLFCRRKYSYWGRLTDADFKEVWLGMVDAHIVAPSVKLFQAMVDSYGAYQPACAELKDTYCNNLRPAMDENPELFKDYHDTACFGFSKDTYYVPSNNDYY